MHSCPFTSTRWASSSLALYSPPFTTTFSVIPMRCLSRKRCDSACGLSETWLVLATGIGDEFRDNSGIGKQDDGSRDERWDDGWGRPLGRNQRTTDTWPSRTGDSWVAGDSYCPNNQRQRSNEREKSCDWNPAPWTSQCHNDRSRSWGRPSQQQSQAAKDPRQHSLINWATPKNKSRERNSRDRSNNEYRSSQASCRWLTNHTEHLRYGSKTPENHSPRNYWHYTQLETLTTSYVYKNLTSITSMPHERRQYGVS